MLELSEKQLRSYSESDARINLWIGSVRSGKSFVANLAFLKFVREAEPLNMDMILLGRSQQALKRNIVNPLLKLLGARAEYYVGKQELHIGSRTIHVIGANDERAAAKIQGSTFLGALVDEVTILPESVWNMLLSRLSPPGARLYGTTNPDSPYHWLKTNFIDRKDELDLKHWDFNFDDNPSLSPKYVESLKREYTGLWYQRYIDGKWVLAEGAIYDFFNAKDHVVDQIPGLAEEYIVGIDYGTTNPCAFTMIGRSQLTQPNMWVEKEYYYDSQKNLRQKPDSEYAADLVKFISGYYVRGIYIDPSAVSLRVELRRLGISNIFEANNDVLNGIRYVNDLLTNGTLKVCSCCKNLIAEFSTYVWDQKAAQKGIERPMKVNDHCLTKDSLVLTEDGYKEIKDLVGKKGKLYSLDKKTNTFNLSDYENVRLTRENQEIYELELENGNKLKATGDHRIMTQNGWKMMKDLTVCDIITTCKINTLKDFGRFAIGVRIKSIKKVANEDVYCLEVPEERNFVANGIVVHNCQDSLRYACFSHYFNRPHTRVKPEDLDKWYDETRNRNPDLPKFFQEPQFF